MNDDLFIEKLEKMGKGIQRKVKLPDTLDKTISNKVIIPKKKVMFKLNIGIAALIGLIILSTGVMAVSTYIFDKGPIDQGLVKAEEDGKVNYLNCSASDKNIKVTVIGAISDEIRTVVQVDVSGKLSGKGVPELNGIQLLDEEGNEYHVTNWGSGLSDNSKKLSEQTNIEFKGGPTKKATLTLKLRSINSVSGYWEIKFPVEANPLKEQVLNNSVKNDGNTLKVKKVKFSATLIEIDGSLESNSWIKKAILSNGKTSVEWSSGQKYLGDMKLFFPPIEQTNKLSITVILNDSNQTKLDMPLDIKNN